MKLKANKWVWHKIYRTRCYIIQVMKKGRAYVHIPDSIGETLVFKQELKKLKHE